MPLNIGVISVESTKLFIVIIGAVVSTVPVCEPCATLPALSDTLAVTVNSPSLKVIETSILQVPSSLIVVTNCCSVPALSVTIILITLPGSRPWVEPVSVGVVSFVSAILLIVTLGAVRSTAPITVTVPLLPAVSLTVAATVKSPSLRTTIMSAV